MYNLKSIFEFESFFYVIQFKMYLVLRNIMDYALKKISST